ncbi:uncharacterized protein LOC121386465 isoform X2 [Gigantopelta aegis]|uniref:uncharacterized protein LOC121386465 isoform X2 n=1 Tax=Gigantopelta aegis TaxID=1735272 RepID=UPI001B88AE14|nr:uncharacterized protein LOC121386465 isoform X2 [Gigantopelta aegis]
MSETGDGHMDENNNNKESSTAAMRRDNTWNASMETEHPEISDDANLSVSYTPGKKGGSFGLPLGAKISIEEGTFLKKDHITCLVLAPSDRWRQNPQLAPDEHIASEYFHLTSSHATLKKPVIVQLPFYPIDDQHMELNVKGKWKDDTDWINTGFLKKEDSSPPCIELELTKLGIFVVTFTPKREVFDVTTQGCLYNARRNRQISIRFPKKGIDQNIQCSLQIKPIVPETLQFCKAWFPTECRDLVTASEFIDILPNINPTFKRAATVKLPLPAGVEVEGDSTEDIAVVTRTDDQGWVLVKSHYRFTRNSVSCDVRHLSRFCVCQTRPSRQTAMPRAASVLESRTMQDSVALSVFLSVREKSWRVLVEAFPEDRAEARINKRTCAGFIHLKREERGTAQEENKFFNNRRALSAKECKRKPDTLEVFEGHHWEVNFHGDVKVSFESDFHDNKVLEYFKYLPESYRSFTIEPRNNEEKALSGIVELTAVHGAGDKENAKIQFKVNIDEDAVKLYFRPEGSNVLSEPEPEPEPEKAQVSFSCPVVSTSVPEPKIDQSASRSSRQISIDVTERLTRLPRRAKIASTVTVCSNVNATRLFGGILDTNALVEKESRVLSGKSLMNIAKVVQEGLTLAVHLDLPDSTITGLGFDAIANGLGMADVTYKILLYWKRRLKNRRDGAVTILSSALRDMGKTDVAELVEVRHLENMEITSDCFEFVNQ